jgi:sterol desaturase/sphingolipid hydroxylase (fatty acid hydroxylase superfamily)
MIWSLLERYWNSGSAMVLGHAFTSLSMLTFFVVGAISFALTRLREPGRVAIGALLDHCFPWVHWKSASTRVDIIIYFAAKFSQKWIVLFSAWLVVALASDASDTLRVWLHMDSTMIAGPAALLIISIVFFVFTDLGEFLSHLVQHKVKLLWEFHKIHHSATFLTPFTTYRFHPVGNFLDGFFIGLCLVVPVCVCQLLYQLTYPELVAISGGADLVMSLLLMSSLQHSHFPISFGWLERVFISPQMHQLHHSVKRAHWGKNLGGKLSIWDWCYGSAFLLPKGEKLTFGMGTIEDQRGDYTSIWWCYVGPLVGVAQRICLMANRGGGHAADADPTLDHLAASD